MIRDGINGMIDLKWHIAWIQHFSKQLAEGIWYPRWLSGTNYGYGSPTFVFYPPLVYYFASLLKFSGLSMEQVIIFLFSLGLFLSGLNFYIFGRDRWGAIPSFVGALIYMSAPYMAFDVYWRGGIASLFAQALIPLGWWLTDKALVQGNSKWRVGVALFWTTIALTHIPSLLICTIAWLIYVLVCLSIRPWKNVVAVLVSAGIGLGIASFYLVPAILEKVFVSTEVMKTMFGEFHNYMFGSSLLPLFSLEINKFFLPKNVYNMSYLFTHQSLVIIVFTIIALVLCDRAIVRETRSWFAFAALMVFLMLPLSAPIWEASSTLQMLQFPWRFLQIYLFIAAALGGVAVNGVMKLKWRSKLLVAMSIALIILSNFWYFYKLSRQFTALGNPGKANLELMPDIVYIKRVLNDPFTDKLLDVPEYRPQIPGSKSPPEPVIKQSPVNLVSGQAEVAIDKWGSYQRILKIKVQQTSTIGLRTYYYPAWHLYVNDRSHPIEMSNDGTMQFQLEPGIYAVELNYQWTSAFKSGILLSIVSIFALILSSMTNLNKRFFYLKQRQV
jgi:uncharacterized membrane protein